ncbi:MAG: rhodanese-like domain-containing protein [Chloroflexota bacterium]|nr:MAG: rhodanese-like domain-containing protein [Chloroflexota bacterium]
MNLHPTMPNQTRYKKFFRTSIFYILIISILIGASLAACTTKPVAGKLIVSAPDAYQLYQDDVFVLDVRTPEEYQDAHLPGATLIPLEELEARSGELPQNETILVYCRSGNRSLQAVYLLENAGFDRVHSLDRGIKNWIQNGFEVE